MKKARRPLQRRALFVLACASVLYGALVARLVWLQVEQGPALRTAGARQVSSFVALPAMRGPIVDANGRVMVTAVPRYDLALDPSLPAFHEQEDDFYSRYADLTGTTAAAVRQKVENRRSPKYVVLGRGLDERQMETIRSWETKGLIVTTRYERRYTYGETMAHVLGHVGRDGHGLAGLEVQYDEYLQGHDGRRAAQRDRRGRLKALVGGRVVEPQHGHTVALTLDLIRQTMLEEELARGFAETGGRWATALAMDPKTGAVLAMANLPTYDPNAAGRFDDFHQRNHAVTDQIEPGSTFKLVAAAAAVEAGEVRMDEAIATGDGWGVFAGRTLRDAHALGTVSFEDVIAQSSNVGTARVATRMGKQPLYRMARDLGFGEATGIDLPGEASGRLRSLNQWSRQSVASVAIGYEVAATPIQVLAAYCALANGGLLVTPHVVAEVRDVTGRVVYSPRRDSVRRAFSTATARALRPAFERVVAAGTGTNAQIEGLDVAGKTGTARRSDRGGYVGGYRSSFVGFFPADDPQVALLVVVDGPTSSIYGGQVSAPIFQRIATRWLTTLPSVAERIHPVRPLPAPKAAPTPRVHTMPVQLAMERLRARGLAVSPDAVEGTPGPHRPVQQQSPVAGAAARPGTPVRLVAATATPSRMPDLVGLSARQARYWLATLGVDVRIDGAGVVRSQVPRAGAALPERATLTAR